MIPEPERRFHNAVEAVASVIAVCLLIVAFLTFLHALWAESFRQLGYAAIALLLAYVLMLKYEERL